MKVLKCVLLVLLLSSSALAAGNDTEEDSKSDSDSGDTGGSSSSKSKSKDKDDGTFRLSRYSMLVKDLKLDLVYDGESSRLALTSGLPLAVQIHDAKKLADAKAKQNDSTSDSNSAGGGEGQPPSDRASEEEEQKKEDKEAAASPIVASIPVLANATEVTGTVKEEEDEKKRKSVVNTLKIKFDGLSVNGTKDSKLNKLEVDIVMITYWTTGYWELKSLTVSAEGTLSSGAFSVNNSVVVQPRNGYTSNLEDRVCGRGYTICAPADLCWTCSVMDLPPMVASGKGGDAPAMLAGIMIPGMKLQPFYIQNGTQTAAEGNKTAKPRFGYDWDCDPVIPSSLWAILLITLFLAILFGWAVSYIADAKGPDRFDTQKTIPMLSKAE